MLIEFEGQITQKNLHYRLKKANKFVILILILAPVIVGVIGSTFGLIFDTLKDVLIITAFCLIISWSFAFIYPKIAQKRILKCKIYQHIKITENELTLDEHRCDKSLSLKYDLFKVNKIIDGGEAYYIIFKYGDIADAWICQKENLKNGTLEEFELFFQSKFIKELN